MAAAELLKFNDADFERTIQRMELKDLLDAIALLQREMTKEQANFNALSNELGSLNKNSRQYKQINKQMALSQNKLTTLMNRSMKCFQQQGNQHNKQKQTPPTVQRHNSSRDTKDGTTTITVQRRHSEKLNDAEIIKTSDKSPTNKPVILKPLTNVDPSNLSVKKQGTSSTQPSVSVTAPKPANQVNGTNSVINKPSTAVTVSSSRPAESENNSKASNTKPSAVVNGSTNVSVVNNIKKPVTGSQNTASASKPSDGLNLYEARNVMFEHIKKFDKESELNKTTKKTSEPVEIQLAIGTKNKMQMNDNREPEVKKSSETSNNQQSQVKVNTQSTVVKANIQPTQIKVNSKPTQVQVNAQPTQNKVNTQPTQVKVNAQPTEVKVNPQPIQVKVTNQPSKVVVSSEKEDDIVLPQLSVKQQIALAEQQRGNAVQPAVKEKQPVVKKQEITVIQTVKKTEDVPSNNSDTNNQSSKMVSNPSDNSCESETESEDEALPPSPGEPEKFVSQVTFAHKPLNKPEVKSASEDKHSKVSVAAPVAAAVASKVEESKTAVEDIQSDDDLEEGDEEIAPKHRNLKDWDPTKLLKELYAVKLLKDDAEDVSDKFVSMEGLMEKLPMNKKKATLLKTWKRRFFRAKDGWLHYFETASRDTPSDSLQLMGGRVEDLGNRILGIDDGRGRFLMVRCPTDREYGQWKLALESQTVNNVRSTYVKPVLSSPPHPNRKVVLIDIGSSGIRAGILGQQPSLPQVFFPSVVARSKKSENITIGIEAYQPAVRQICTLMKAVRPTSRVDKADVGFNVDTEVMPAVFAKIFKELNIDPSQYWVMMSTPQNLADPLKAGLFEILVDQYKVKGICMVMQSLLALYSYNATSGIIVDIGQRMEILPIYDGYVIEGGVSRQSYGGRKVAECLNSSLTSNKYVFVTPVEELIVRYVMEKSCFVTDDFKESKKLCDQTPEKFSATVNLSNYDLPPDAHVYITHDQSRFDSPEGFFNTDLWGMDYPCIHKLVFQAIQTCPIDSRKHMYRSIYLSGGVTMTPGFAERLQAELAKLAPPSVIVEVHSSPQRYHAAYIGACALGNMGAFEQTCISAEEWKRLGNKAFKKWSMSPT